MEIIKKHLTNGQYVTSIFEKLSLFVHHTSGTTAKGAWRWWNSTPDRVGTADIVDRDGSIIECFDPSMWAYHLGVKNDDNWHEKHSIGIEIVSAGRLYFDEGEYRFYPLYPNKMRYITIPEDEVHVFKKPWRGHRYFHKYSEAQIKSLCTLIKDLVLDYNIPLQESIESFYEFNDNVIDKHLPGLWSHSTVRRDKDDIAPIPDLMDALIAVHKEILDIRRNVQIPEATIKSSKKAPSKSSKKASKS